VVTNAYGFYSITVPAGQYSMVISFSGYATDTVSLNLEQNTVVNRMMSAGGSQMQEVVVTGRKGNNILVTPPGVQHLNMDDIKDLPVLLGEKDVLKTIQLLPGVKSAGDGKSGFFVRGGGADQNLILLDEATVYNASHSLGFFSVFNSDAIKDVTLYKGGMPANFGGRLASVEDIKMKDGNDQKMGVSGGIGLIDDTDPLHSQQHYIFPVLRGALPGGIEYSVGPGIGLTGGTPPGQGGTPPGQGKNPGGGG